MVREAGGEGWSAPGGFHASSSLLLYRALAQSGAAPLWRAVAGGRAAQLAVCGGDGDRRRTARGRGGQQARNGRNAGLAGRERDHGGRGADSGDGLPPAATPHLVLLVAGIVDGVEPVVVGAFAHGIFGRAWVGEDDVVMAPVVGHAVGLGRGLVLALVVVLGHQRLCRNHCRQDRQGKTYDQTREPKHVGVPAQIRVRRKRTVQCQYGPPTFKENRGTHQESDNEKVVIRYLLGSVLEVDGT